MFSKGLRITCVVAIIAAFAFSTRAGAQRQMEHLDRGVVAIHRGEGEVFMSWRLLGSDPEEIAFNCYR